MAQSALEVSNIALTKLGEDVITDLSATGKVEEACNLILEPTKKALLRLHPWNFALKRNIPDLLTVTATEDNGAGEVRLTLSAAHGWTTGDKVTVANIVGTTEANGTWELTTVVGETTKLDLDDTTYANAWESGGTAGYAPQFGFLYAFSLPSDCLRLLSVDEEDIDPESRLEAGRVLTDNNAPELLYVYNVSDYTLMDWLFYEALSTRLAINLCLRLNESEKKKEELWADFNRIISKARFVDGTEDSPRKLEALEWLDARSSYSSDYVNDPNQ